MYNGLEKALDFIITKQDQALKMAVSSLGIDSAVAKLIITHYAQNLLDEVLCRKKLSLNLNSFW